MSITPERANAYVHHYTNSADLAEPHDPIRATVFTMCAVMCLMARLCASFSAQAAFATMVHANGREPSGLPEETNPYG